MRKKNIAAAALVLLILLPSCFNTAPLETEVKLREFAAEDDTPALNAAMDFCGGFIKALKTGEFVHWQKKLPPQSAAKIGEKEFTGMRKELTGFFGNLEQSSYFGELTTGNFRNYLWKLRFVKEENQKKIINEVVFFVRVFCEEGKPPAVSGFGVKRF